MNTQKIKDILKDPKTNWKYLAIVAVLAFIAGAIIMNCLSKTEFEIPQIAFPKRIDETKDWKTYRNEGYGFEVKYPPCLSSFEFIGTRQQLADTVKFINTSLDKIAFSVLFFYEPKELLEERYEFAQKLSDVIIDGYRGEKRFQPKDPPAWPYEMIIYLISNKKIVIIFESANFHDISGTEIDQIFSTFKFLE